MERERKEKQSHVFLQHLCNPTFREGGRGSSMETSRPGQACLKYQHWQDRGYRITKSFEALPVYIGSSKTALILNKTQKKTKKEFMFWFEV